MKKKYLIGLGIIAIIIGLALWWGYDSFLKPDPEIQAQLIEEFGTEFFTNFDEQVPVDPPSVPGWGETQPTIADSQQKPSSFESGISTDVQAEEQVILQKYAPGLGVLQNQALARLDILVAAAAQEYKEQQQTGSPDSKALARKYLEASNMLEENVDGEFYRNLNAMEAELIQNNLSTAVVADIEKQYINAKAKKRSEMVERFY